MAVAEAVDADLSQQFFGGCLEISRRIGYTAGTALALNSLATAAAAYITSGFRFSHPHDTHPKRTAPLASGSDRFAAAP